MQRKEREMRPKWQSSSPLPSLIGDRHLRSTKQAKEVMANILCKRRKREGLNEKEREREKRKKE